MWCNTQWIKYFFHSMVLITELDRENPDLPPYLISHGQKIESSRVLLATHSKVDDCVYAALQVWSAHCGRNISALEVAQSYSVSLRALFSKDPSRPNFCSIADGAIIRGGIGSPGSPYLILWSWYKLFKYLPTKYGLDQSDSISHHYWHLQCADKAQISLSPISCAMMRLLIIHINNPVVTVDFQLHFDVNISMFLWHPK